jgi:hypothetical protein
MYIYGLQEREGGGPGEVRHVCRVLASTCINVYTYICIYTGCRNVKVVGLEKFGMFVNVLPAHV